MRMVRTWRMHRLDGRLHFLAMEPCVDVAADGTVASAAEDGRICLYSGPQADLGVFLDVTTINEAHSGAVVNVLTFMPDGTLVRGAADSTIKIWAPVTFKEVRKVTGARSGITALAVLGNGDQLLSGSEEGVLYVRPLE